MPLMTERYSRPSASGSCASFTYAGRIARLIGAMSSTPGMLAISAETVKAPRVAGPVMRPMKKAAERSFRKDSRFCIISHFEKCSISEAAASENRGRSGWTK